MAKKTAKPKVRQKAVKKVERAIKKAMKKDVPEDIVEETVKAAMIVHRKPSTKKIEKDPKAGKPVNKPSSANIRDGDAD
jgi:hypothetical protein